MGGDGWELTMTCSFIDSLWDAAPACSQLSPSEWLVLAEAAGNLETSYPVHLRMLTDVQLPDHFQTPPVTLLAAIQVLPCDIFLPECGKRVLRYRATLHTRAGKQGYSSSFFTWQPFLWYGENIYFYGICVAPSGLVSDNYAAREKWPLLLISQLALKKCSTSLKPSWRIIFFPLCLHTLCLCHFNSLSSCQTGLIQDVW